MSTFNRHILKKNYSLLEMERVSAGNIHRELVIGRDTLQRLDSVI